MLGHESVKFPLADFDAADIRARRNKQPGGLAPAARSVHRGAQRFEPIHHFGQGVVLLRIHQHQRQGGFVEKQLGHEPVVFLPGEVLQQRFPLCVLLSSSGRDNCQTCLPCVE